MNSRMKANGKVRDILTMYRPIAAVIGGFQAAPGRIMGHAGAWTGLGEGTSESKYKALEGAGVTMVDHPAKFGSVMRDILAKSGRSVNRIVRSNAFPRQITKCELTSSRSNQQLKSNNAVHTTHHASHAVRSHHRRAPRCGFPEPPLRRCSGLSMSGYYEPPQWPPSGQAGWDHQTPPPARSGMSHSDAMRRQPSTALD